MSKVKVKRKVKGDDGKEQVQELEIEEAEKKDGDEIIPAQAPGKKEPEKLSLTEEELNQKLAAARREAEREAKNAREELATYKKSIEDKEKAANDAAAKKVADLRKDLPESIGKLLDKLSPTEQLEWLSDPANAIEKKQIGPLPTGRDEPGKGPRTQVII